jgi:hypothetical protein
MPTEEHGEKQQRGSQQRPLATGARRTQLKHHAEPDRDGGESRQKPLHSDGCDHDLEF